MIYRLPNRLVRVAQASCPPRDRFAVANLFSAKGALSSLAWGNRSRHSVTSATSAEGAVQFEGGHPPWVASESRFQRRWFSNRANPGASPQVRHGESVLWRTGANIAPLARHISKAMRGRIALQSTSCEMGERTLLGFAQALGVRMRPRIAFNAAPHKHAGSHLCFSHARAGLPFRRSQKRLGTAANRLQSGASSLRTHE